MGQFVSIADFLVSKGLALRKRKPRSVISKGSAYAEYQIQLAVPVVGLSSEPLPVSLLYRGVAADEKPKQVGAQAPVMESPADDTRTFRSVSANIPIPSQIGILSTRARPKLLPRTLVSAEKVL